MIVRAVVEMEAMAVAAMLRRFGKLFSRSVVRQFRLRGPYNGGAVPVMHIRNERLDASEAQAQQNNDGKKPPPPPGSSERVLCHPLPRVRVPNGSAAQAQSQVRWRPRFLWHALRLPRTRLRHRGIQPWPCQNTSLLTLLGKSNFVSRLT